MIIVQLCQRVDNRAAETDPPGVNEMSRIAQLCNHLLELHRRIKHLLWICFFLPCRPSRLTGPRPSCRSFFRRPSVIGMDGGKAKKSPGKSIPHSLKIW